MHACRLTVLVFVQDSSTMSKRFTLAHAERTSPSTSPHLTTTDCRLCLICQEDKMETLTKPDQSKRKDIGSGYSSLAENFESFAGSFHLERLDDGHGIEAAMVEHGAQYHQTCRLQYNNTTLQRAQKRAIKKEGQSDEEQSSWKCARAHSRSLSTEMVLETCLSCVSAVCGLHYWFPSWNSSITLATSGPATIQRRRALGLSVSPTAPPSPFDAGIILPMCLD